MRRKQEERTVCSKNLKRRPFSPAPFSLHPKWSLRDSLIIGLMFGGECDLVGYFGWSTSSASRAEFWRCHRFLEPFCVWSDLVVCDFFPLYIPFLSVICAETLLFCFWTVFSPSGWFLLSYFDLNGELFLYLKRAFWLFRWFCGNSVLLITAIASFFVRSMGFSAYLEVVT